MLLSQIGNPIKIQCNFDAENKITSTVHLIYADKDPEEIPLSCNLSNNLKFQNHIYATLTPDSPPFIGLAVNKGGDSVILPGNLGNLTAPIDFNCLTNNKNIVIGEAEKKLLELIFKQKLD